VTIDPLTEPADVAVKVVAVGDCACPSWERNKRLRVAATNANGECPLRLPAAKELSSLGKTNDRRYFRVSDIYFLEYFSLMVKKRMNYDTCGSFVIVRCCRVLIADFF